jgi:hypothetical protein
MYVCDQSRNVVSCPEESFSQHKDQPDDYPTLLTSLVIFSLHIVAVKILKSAVKRNTLGKWFDGDFIYVVAWDAIEGLLRTAYFLHRDIIRTRISIQTAKRHAVIYRNI